MATAADYNNVVQALYVAYFGRPADPIGLANLTAALAAAGVPSTVDGLQAAYGSNATVKFYVDAFGTSAESEALYTGQSTAQFVDDIFVNVLGRHIGNTAAELQGLYFWVNAIDSGVLSKGDAALAIMQGALHNTSAQGLIDAQTVANKLAVAANFTAAIDTAPEVIGYYGADAAAAARTMLNGVTATTDVTAFQNTVTSTLATIVAASTNPPGVTDNMTVNSDNFAITTANTLDTVKGIISYNGTTDSSTWTVGDTVKGNGLTTLEVAVANINGGTYDSPYSTITGVEKLSILSGAASGGTLVVEGSNFDSALDTVSLAGKSGLDVQVNDVVSNASQFAVSIAGATTGSITAASTGTSGVLGHGVFKVGDLNAYAFAQNNVANSVGASVKIGAGGIDINLGKSGYASAALSHSATGSHADVSVGDINIAHVNVNVGTSATAETVQVYNYASATGHNATAGNITIGDVAFNLKTEATAYLKLTNEAYVNSGKGAALAGNLTVGNISGTVGSSADLYVYGYNYADNYGTGNATVGNLTVGNVDLTNKYYAYLYFSNEAYINAHAGAALAGDLTIGNITVANGTDDFYAYGYNYAMNHGTGNATVGDLKVGDVSVSGSDYAYLSFKNEAHAYHKGAAVAGDLTLGNVTLTHNDSNDYSLYAYNYAYADVTGDATVGNITVGDVTVKGTYYAEVEFENYADAVKGNATAGDVTVGNLTLMNSGTTEDIYAYVYNSATAKTGNATVGNIHIGNIAMTASNYNYLDVSESAWVTKTGDATVGNITVGNISMKAISAGEQTLYLDAYAYVANNTAAKGGAATIGDITTGDISMVASTNYNELYVYEEAYNKGTKTHDAAIGNLTIGNVAMEELPGNSGYNQLYVYRFASAAHHGDASVGDVKIGDISINADNGITQTGAYNEITVYNTAHAVAGKATVGSITIGNVVGNTGTAGQLYLFAENYAHGTTSGTTGKVTIGNVTFGGASTDLTVYAENYATNGTAGGITVGNVSLHGTAAHGQAILYVQEDGGAVGNVHVGNVAATAAEVSAYISNNAYTGDAGNTTVGNITLKGDNNGSHNWVYQNATSGSVGTVTVGNVSLSDSKGQVLDLYVSNLASTAHGTAGAVTIGNVNIAVAVTKSDAATAATGALHVVTNGKSGGDITIGNISVGSSGIVTTKTAAANMANVHVTATSTDGNVTVGNVTVTGGVIDKALNQVDNLEALTSWLKLTAGGDITIGNVDYSGYAGAGKAANLIDVSGFAGAAVIKGSTGGSTITDNDGTNAITLSNTTKADQVILGDVQKAVTDASTSDGDLTVTAQSSVDSITGFATGDIITLGGNGIKGDGVLIQNGSSMSWSTFLTNAEHQIDTVGHSGYTAIVGGNTYVALGGWDANNHLVVTEIVEVVGVHTFTISGSDLTFAS